MKKVLILSLALFIAIIPVFAEGQIGISLTPEWFWLTSAEGQQASVSTGMTRFMLTVDGANYFGEGGGFGLEYGLGMIFPVNRWQGNITVGAEGSSVGFVFRAGAGYRYEFTDFIGFVAGIGLNGFYQTESQMYEGYTITGSEFDLHMYGRITADVTFIDCLRVNAGLAIGGPLYVLQSASYNGEHASQNLHIGGVFVAPFVGVSYVY